MKEPWRWNEEDLLSLISSGTKESIELDYKESAALANTDGKKNELSKDVSAFANSAGGTIVYGMVEDGHIPIRLDTGYDPSAISKEWLDQVINSRIQRRIDGVRIVQVELTTTSPGRVAYVVHIPQSSRAPHQASDKKFYKRFNFESVPMEEYEVRDVALRLESADLRLTYGVRILPPANAEATAPPAVVRMALAPSVTNEAPTPVEYSVISLLIDRRLKVVEHPRELHVGKEKVNVGKTEYECTSLSLNHSLPGRMPFFQGVDFRLLDSPVVVEVPLSGRFLIGSRLRAPRMNERMASAFLESTGAVFEGDTDEST